MRRGVVFHLTKPSLDDCRRSERLALFPHLADLLSARGHPCSAAPREDWMMAGREVPGDGRLHIVEGGWCYGPGWLSAAIAYLPGFWHLAEEGVLADSPARHAVFDAAEVDGAGARAFATDLRRRFVQPRRSRYGQAGRPPESLPAGAIAVFLQGPAVYRRMQAFLGATDMLCTVSRHAEGRQVLVKPHPLTPGFGREAIARARARGAALVETEANVHDILAASAVTVSVNSAVAFEGFLHGRPAILCGRSDFHSLAECVLDADEFPGALDRALTVPRDFDAMLHWYFSRHTLGLDAPDFAQRALGVIDRAAAGLQRGSRGG